MKSIPKAADVFWKILFFLALAAIAIACFWSTPIPYTQPPLDKYLHVLGFAALGVCMFRALSWPLWLSAIQLLVLGVVIELGQEWFLPMRTFSVLDVLADTFGIMVAVVFELAARHIALRYTD